jgi:membrane protein implicated in regulation of membrane protease activity
MGAFFESLSPLQKVFFICAAGGGLLFILRMIVSLIGGHHDSDMGGDVDAHGDGHFDDHHDHHDSDSSFKILSLQSLTAFFMMFGLVGLALSKQSRLASFWSVLGAVIGGFFAIWVIGKIFRSMRYLQSDGTLDMKNAMFKEGTVYLTIPADGEGKVQITVQDALREFTAVSANKEEIKTDEPVRVVDIKHGNVLVVKKVK